jgi:hypothetical protein
MKISLSYTIEGRSGKSRNVVALANKQNDCWLGFCHSGMTSARNGDKRSNCRCYTVPSKSCHLSFIHPPALLLFFSRISSIKFSGHRPNLCFFFITSPSPSPYAGYCSSLTTSCILQFSDIL